MKLKIAINNRWTGEVIFEFETEENTVSKTINEYLRQWKEKNGIYSRADLTGADLTGANLTGADLTSIKADFFLVLLNAKHEVAGLKQALIDGKIDGSTYSGACACLVGTIANIKGCNYDSLPGISPNASRPAERWFLGINPGLTPEKNTRAKITLEWIEEFERLVTN